MGLLYYTDNSDLRWGDISCQIETEDNPDGVKDYDDEPGLLMLDPVLPIQSELLYCTSGFQI